MKKFKLFLAAALLFAAACFSSSLLAQVVNSGGHYATVVKEGSEYILYIKHHNIKPLASGSTVYVQPQELSNTSFSANSFMIPDADLRIKITQARIDVLSSFKPTSTAFWFFGLSNLKHIIELESLDMSSVTNATSMFELCVNIGCICLSPMNALQNASYMFCKCYNLKYVILNCYKNKLSDITSMFDNCEKLIYIFFKDLNSKDPEKTGSLKSNITSPNCFRNCYSLKTYHVTQYKNVKWEDSKIDKKGFTDITASGYLTTHYNTTTRFKGVVSTSVRCSRVPELYQDQDLASVDLSEHYLAKHIGLTNIDRKKPDMAFYVDTIPFEYLRYKFPSINTDEIKRVDVSFSYKTAPKESDTLTLTIDIFADKVTSVEIIKEPTKKEYTLPLKKEDIDLTGGTIQKTYKSGKTETVTMTSQPLEIVSESSFALAGEYTILIKFLFDKAFYIDFKITIKKDKVKEVYVSSEPIKKEYHYKDFDPKNLDLSDGKIKLTYSSGKTEEIPMPKKYYIEKNNQESYYEGYAYANQNLTLKFDLDDTVFFWNFKVKILEELKRFYVKYPNKTIYRQPFTAKDLDLRGGFITKIYSIQTVVLPMDTLRYDIIGLDINSVGNQRPTLKFDLGDTVFDWIYYITVLGDVAEDSTGSGDEPGSGEEPGEEPSEEPGEGDEPIVAVEAAGFGGGAAFEAWTSSGVLSVKAVRGGVLEVLSVNGVLLRRVEVAGGSLNLPLEKGVYVLRLGGEVKKVVIE